MMLTDDQLRALLDIIDRHHAAFIANFVSPSVLPPDVLERLESLGMVRPQVQGVRDAYVYGVLAASLPDKPGQRRRMTYAQLADRLQRQPIPLSPVEQQAVSVAQMTAGQYISGLGARVKVQATQRVMQADTATRARDRRAYQKTIAHAVEQRKQVSSVVSDLGHATGDWARNLERVATTELSAALQQGTAQVIGRDHGGGARVAKQFSSLCCDQCRRLYSLDGGQTPRIFSLAELEANGTNVGRKAKAWRPVIGPTHPNCLVRGEPVTTARGMVPVEQVVVGDWVLTHLGRWRQVTHTHASSYLGELRRIFVAGSADPLTCTAEHPLAVGPGAFAPASQVRPGQPLVSMLAAACPQPARATATALARVERWVGEATESLLLVRTPWGAFSQVLGRRAAEQDVLPALVGAWRMNLVGLTRLAGMVAQTRSFGGAQAAQTPSDMPSVLAREDRPLPAAQQVCGDVDRSRGPALLARQTVAVRRIGERLFFNERPRRPEGPGVQPRYLPRRVTQVQRLRWQGAVFNLSVDEDETYVARALVQHNCGCVLVHVPEGMAFNAEGHMVAAPPDTPG